MFQNFTSLELIVNLLAGFSVIIIGLIFIKKQKKWGVYVSALGAMSLVVNAIRFIIIV
jgi:hypothetical protein